jgi:hypothetical protein
MTKYEGKTLAKAVFVVEDCCFLNCELKDCDLFYSGGDFDFVNLKMNDCRWHFRGPALKTIQLQQMIGMMKPVPFPPGMGPKTSAAGAN